MADADNPAASLPSSAARASENSLVAVLGLQIGMLAEKVRDLGLDRLGQQSTRPIAQDFGELIVDVSWLNQLDDVIFGHGISLLRWRSGGVKHPHDMPPSRFPEHKCIARPFWVEHLLGDLRTGDREALDWEQAHLDKDRSLIPIDVLVG